MRSTPTFKIWPFKKSAKRHLLMLSNFQTFNPMGTGGGVFFARGSLKCLPFLNQWSNCLDSSWLFLNWWILQACRKKFICTLVIILCYFILFYEVSRFLANDTLIALVTFTFSPYKSPTNCIWPPLGDWPLWPNHVRCRNVWYIVGKIIHRAIFSQKLKFLPWSSDALLAIKVPAGEKDLPWGSKGKKSPGPIGLK